uniref:Ribonuclease H1 N-terminal domain-containing protein n=1 Tax=Physcomitrium patens TaxID=3218 RepID=A0A2K1KG60_PHYPA|nr:hypothetical protein PHYPA_009130 [Physcomitrium patens]
MGINKYYVVHRGFKPGVYTNWIDCEKDISGYGNVKFCNFKEFGGGGTLFVKDLVLVELI